MSKGLEAFQRLAYPLEKRTHKEIEEDLHIIEKELKRLEDLDSILNTGGGIWAVNGIVSKKLKALEILKEKQIDILYLSMSHSLEQYNKHVSFIHNEWCLIQEEYDLLREALL